jgi:hypothetical protein
MQSILIIICIILVDAIAAAIGIWLFGISVKYCNKKRIF